MIETVSLRNFKVLREIAGLRLSPFTLIVGPNASGKSSLLEALFYLMAFPSAPHIFPGSATSRHSLLTRGSNGPVVIGCQAHFYGEALDLSIGHPHNFEPAQGRWRGSEIDDGAMDALAMVVRPAAMLRLDVRKLAAPSYPQKVDLSLPADGEGLSSVLAFLSLSHPTRFQNLIAQLKSVVPQVRDVRLKPADIDKKGIGYELYFDMQGAADVAATEASDGTLVTLGLLTSLAVPVPPQLVLIDELERGLHPKALGDLVQQLRLIQEQNPELQIVATSHSPYLLDHFKAEEILLTSLDEEGYAVVKPLTDHPEYERWKDLMAPGEFWSTVGEKWITESSVK